MGHPLIRSRCVTPRTGDLRPRWPEVHMSDDQNALRVALGHAWHNERTSGFCYDEWAALVEKLLGPKRPGQCDHRDLEAARLALDEPETAPDPVLDVLEGLARLGTAQWLEDTYQQANQAGMVAHLVKGLRAVVREEVENALRNAGTGLVP